MYNIPCYYYYIYYYLGEYEDMQEVYGIKKEEMIYLLKQSVADYRYVHAQNVAETAKILAYRFNVDTEKATA